MERRIHDVLAGAVDGHHRVDAGVARRLDPEQQRVQVRVAVGRDLGLHLLGQADQGVPIPAFVRRRFDVGVLLQQVGPIEQHQRAGFLGHQVLLVLVVEEFDERRREVVGVVRRGVEEVGVAHEFVERLEEAGRTTQLEAGGVVVDDVPGRRLGLHGCQPLGVVVVAGDLLDFDGDFALGVVGEFRPQAHVGVRFGASKRWPP